MPAPTSSRSTAYRAVAADLRALVTDGGYGQDQPLPTEMDLAQRYASAGRPCDAPSSTW